MTCGFAVLQRVTLLFSKRVTRISIYIQVLLSNQEIELVNILESHTGTFGNGV